jgi:glycosyltransferase involved in cell wall biosynthesis
MGGGTLSLAAGPATGAGPFFSIGVTTYDRRELLKETLHSILRQTFPDFEVLVGNDNPGETLTGKLLGIEDERISFINRPANLGELGNMNALLRASRGRYFTWLADDDLYAGTFLENVHGALVALDPPVAFTSYAAGEDGAFEETTPAGGSSGRSLEGFAFLGEYLSRRLKVIGCYGVFRKDCLERLGGMEQLGSGFSPYSDNLLVIRACTLGRVAYLEAPLLLFRTHGQSISYTSPDVDAYRSAQADLLARCLPLFRSEELRDHLRENLFHLLLWCLQDFEGVVRRASSIRPGQAAAYLLLAGRYLPLLAGTPHFRRVLVTLLRIFWKFHRDGLVRGGRRIP